MPTSKDRRWTPQLKQSEGALSPPLSSSQTLNGWAEARMRWAGGSLLSADSGAMISAGTILIETPRNNILPALQASLSPVKLTHKTNHQKWY